LQAYGNPDQRELAAAEAQRCFCLNEAQLVCLLFAPFVENGASLEHFLRQCHPGMLVALPDLHRAMQGKPAPEQVLQWMVDVSGLPVSLIGTLYRMGPVAGGGTAGTGLPADTRAIDVVTGERSTGR